MSCLSPSAARTTLRPIRPKPLTPTLIMVPPEKGLRSEGLRTESTTTTPRGSSVLSPGLQLVYPPMSVEPIRWRDGALELLDQRKLPREVVYVTCRTPHDVAVAIRDMVVRGAPAIGVSAAFGMALAD